MRAGLGGGNRRGCKWGEDRSRDQVGECKWGGEGDGLPQKPDEGVCLVRERDRASAGGVITLLSVRERHRGEGLSVNSMNPPPLQLPLTFLPAHSMSKLSTRSGASLAQLPVKKVWGRVCGSRLAEQPSRCLKQNGGAKGGSQEYGASTQMWGVVQMQ